MTGDGIVRCTGDGCGAPIRFVQTELGRRLPIDPQPHPDGTVIAIKQPDGTTVARVLSGDQLPAQQTAWRPHWATCPASPQFRKRKARIARRCRVCGKPMDPDLALRERWTTHPACDPAGHRPGSVTERTT